MTGHQTPRGGPAVKGADVAVAVAGAAGVAVTVDACGVARTTLVWRITEFDSQPVVPMAMRSTRAKPAPTARPIVAVRIVPTSERVLWLASFQVRKHPEASDSNSFSA